MKRASTLAWGQLQKQGKDRLGFIFHYFVTVGNITCLSFLYFVSLGRALGLLEKEKCIIQISYVFKHYYRMVLVKYRIESDLLDDQVMLRVSS